MPLRHRIKQSPETVQDLELASEEKYWEALELLAAGHRGAGIYLLGLAAEMVLKRACFALDGARPYDPVTPRLRPTRTLGRQHFPSIADEHYHSLVFWLQVLRFKRQRVNRPYPAVFENRLIQCVRRLFGIWIIEMRYHPDRSLPREAHSAYDDVTWLRDNRLQLVN